MPRNPPGIRIITALAACAVTGRAWAYVDGAPGLPQIVIEAHTIALVEVTDFSRAKREITLKPTQALKGDLPLEPVTHELASAQTQAIPAAISQWAQPGAVAVLFSTKTIGLVCMGGAWYSVNNVNGAWKIGKERPDLPLAYSGPVMRLAQAAANLAQGKDALITVVSYGADDAGTAFDLAFNRGSLPGLARLDRVHVSPEMLGPVGHVSSMPGYNLGPGPVDGDDLPDLLAQLKSPDGEVRAEAAESIGWIGKKARSAAAALEESLRDEKPRVRGAAAAALLRIAPNSAALEVLRSQLSADDPFLRRDAIQYAGLAGQNAGPLTERLIELLGDKDETTRLLSLKSIAAIGPAAIKAVPALRKLLADPAIQCDAADALGRMGPAARPVPEALAKMLASEDATAQWAAVRAMSQIGGPESRPAVDYMIDKMKNTTVMTESYDMRIYLAMLGPEAAAAVPTLLTNGGRNDKLTSATIWAITADQVLPWIQDPGIAGDAGGPKVIYEAYINNLGERLAPATRLMAGKMIDGTAGNVPVWGYRLLTCAPDEALKIFLPHLMDDDAKLRERAIVGLGYMGSAASSAREPLQNALTKASTDNEKRLIQWALH